MIYVIFLAAVIALTVWADRWKGCGVWIFFISVILSPLVGLIALAVWAEPLKSFTCRHCGHTLKSAVNPVTCPKCGKS